MEKLDFYIDGSWVTPSGVKTLDVINPASEEKVTKISLGE
jgi:aldehyde dehydrogenase (NAD+)